MAQAEIIPSTKLNDTSIKAELAARGISLLPSPFLYCRELIFCGVSLGHFTAGEAADRFIQSSPELAA